MFEYYDNKTKSINELEIGDIIIQALGKPKILVIGKHPKVMLPVNYFVMRSKKEIRGCLHDTCVLIQSMKIAWLFRSMIKLDNMRFINMETTSELKNYLTHCARKHQVPPLNDIDAMLSMIDTEWYENPAFEEDFLSSK